VNGVRSTTILLNFIDLLNPSNCKRVDRRIQRFFQPISWAIANQSLTSQNFRRFEVRSWSDV